MVLSNEELIWHSKVKHLGNVLTDDLSDEEDVKLKVESSSMMSTALSLTFTPPAEKRVRRCLTQNAISMDHNHGH